MRRFFCLVLILSLANPAPGVCRAEELRPIQEGAQQTGLEQRMLQAGAEEGISVYLDPKVKNGRLVKPGKPFRVERKMNRWLWDKPEVKAAKVVALSNMRTTRRKKSGKAQFALSGSRYGIALGYDVDSPPRLLVLADPKTQLPISAYSIPGGELVYSVSEQVQVFLDGTVKDGRLMGSPSPYRLLQMVPAALWEEKAVQDAKTVVLTNVPTGKRDEILSFHVAGQGYPTTLDYVPGETPSRLLVVMDPKARTPSAAYEMNTGKQVFPGSNQMRVYLDPKIERGKLSGNPAPLLITGKATASFWENKEFQGASNIVFADVPTRKSANKENQKNMAVFSVKGKGYSITKAFDPQHPPRLLVVVDLKSREPTTAYNMETGEQLFSAADRIPVYLNPRIKAGRLVGKPEPFALMTRNLVGLLEKGEVKQAATVVLGNIPTKRSTVGKSETSAAFGLSGETYVIDRQFDPDRDLRLLVVVDPSTGFPSEAYDFSTGERVFSAKDLIQVYINPSVRNGRLAGGARPFRIARTVSGKVWNQREIREAETVALSNVSTIHVAGTATFFVDTRAYPTRRKYDAGHLFRVLVIVNPATRIPTVAYDLSTGEEIFSERDLIQFYLDPRIEEGRFAAGEKPFQLSQIPRLTATFWSRPEVKQATTLALANVPASNLRGTAGFYLGNTGYRTTRRFDVDHPLRLIIHEQIEPWLPIAAYDIATGEQIYPVTEASADPRLGALTDLADDQAGAEEISLYLNSRIEDGRRIGGGEPFYAGRYIIGDVWDKPEVRRAKTVVLENVPGVKQGDKFAFNLAAELYLTDLSFNPGKDLRLRILVDPETKLPSEAWDQATGEKVYSAEDLLGVYLDPVLQGGRLAGDSRPFRNLRVIPAGIWDDSAVKTAKRIGIANYPMNRKRGIPRITLARQTYKIEGSFDPNKPPKLFVLIDPKLKRVLAIYDMDTGERLLSKEAIGLYLNPVIENGLLAADSQPFMGLVMGKLTDVFKRKEIQAASAIAFHNFPTRPKKGMAYFNIGGVSYPTGERYDPQSPLRLLVLLDPKSQVPTEAYDLTTGKLLFAGKDYVRIYVDPFIEEGRIKAGTVPDLLVREPRGSLWQRPELRVARKTVGLLGISTYQQRDVAGFNFLDLRYRTTRAYSEKNPPKLLVLVDIQSKLPAEAYDLETGKKVFSAADHIQVFLNPKIENGRLAEGAVPFRLAQRVYNSLRKEIERERPKTVALTNIPTREGPNGEEFSMLGRTYLTSRLINTGAPLRLSVLISARNWNEPVAAYDMATGEQVYPAEEMLAAYLDPEMKNGQVVGGQKLFLRRRQLRSVMWDRASEKGAQFLVVENVKTHNKNGRTVFHLIKEMDLLTSRKFNPRVSLKLVAVGSVKDRRVIAAHDMATGEQVYPVPRQAEVPADARLGALADLAGDEPAQAGTEEESRVYGGGEVKKGKLVGAGKPIWQGLSFFRSSFWDDARLKDSSHIMLENVSTYDQSGASFHWSGKHHRTKRAFDAQHPLRLWVKVSYPDGKLLNAWDMASGEEVYSVAEKIRVYMGGDIEEGSLINAGEMFWEGGMSPRPGYLDDERLKGSSHITVESVRTYRSNNSFFFHWQRQKYPTSRRFDPKKPLRLWLKVSYPDGEVLGAWDMATGEQVYPVLNYIRAYSGGEIENGQLSRAGDPVWQGPQMKKSGFWNDEALRGSPHLMLENMPTLLVSGVSHITWRGRRYPVDLPFDKANPPRLWVKVSYPAGELLGVWDMATGKQVQLAPDEIRVYAGGEIRDGELVEAGSVIWRGGRVFQPAFWEDTRLASVAHLTLENIPTVGKRNRVFVWQKDPYTFNLPFDVEGPLRLWVKVSYPGGEVLGAWDMATGKQVYSPSENIRVYAGGEIGGKGLINAGEPLWERGRRVQSDYWDDARLKKASHLILENVRTAGTRGRTIFAVTVKGERHVYPTGRRFNPKNPLRLWVKVSYPEGEVLGAWDMETRDQVYSAPEKIRVYSGGEIKRNKLAGVGDPIWEGRPWGRAGFFKRARLKGTAHVMLENVTAISVKEKAVFSWAGKYYPTGRSFDENAPLHLWVKLSYPEGEVLGAWDMATGEQVYSFRERVKVYAGGEVKGRKLANAGKPIWQGWTLQRSSLWKDKRLEGASYLVLENVRTYDQAGRASFHWAAKGPANYRTLRVFDAESPMRLWVKVAYPSGKVLGAWDMATGEQVYYPRLAETGDPRLGALTDLADEEPAQAGAEERIRIYRDPEIKNGLVVDGAKPILTVGLMRKEIWGLPETRGSKQLVFDGVRSYRGKGSKARFGFNGEQYTTTMDSSELSRLTVVADVASRLPLKAFQATTGEEVFSSGNHIKLYINPRIIEGRLAPGSIPERQFLNLYPTLWRKVAKLKSGTVALENVSTSGSKGTAKGTAHFSFLSKRYPTRRAYDPTNPLKLLVVADTRLGIPTAAYDLATGEEVYSSSEEIEIYLDPVIEVGRLAEGSKSHLRMQIAGRYLWTDPGVRAAQRIGLWGVPTHQLPKVEWALFSMMKRTFRTTRRFDAERPLRLLVVADVSTREPVAAYDVSTGEQVYSADQQLRVYLDPSFQEGKLGKTAEIYYRTSALIRSTFWKRPEVLKAKRLVFENWPAFSMRSGKLLFSLDYKRYLTDLEGDPAHPGEARLSLVVDPRGPIPLEAYDSKTGRKVFDWNERLRIYADPEIQNGQLGKEAFPIRISNNLSRAILKEVSSKAKVIAIAGVPTHQLSGGTAASFSLLRSRYRVSRLYDPANPLFLLVLMDVKSETVQAAYDMATGEQVYPVKRETAADSRLEELANLAEAGAEEPAARVVRGWKSEEGTEAVVLSSTLLKQPYAEDLKASLKGLPPELAERVYLAGNWAGLKEANQHLNVILNGSPDDVAIAVGQQAPSPEKVWLIGEFAPVYGWMLRQMGMDPEEVTAGADLEEFLSQMGILLGVPEAQVQSGVEELRRLKEGVETEA